MATKVIPNYALYGDQVQASWNNLFDFEWIPKRSRPYNWNISPHKHDAFIQILYLTEGGCEVILDGARLTATAPCLIVIPAQTVHGFVFDTTTNGPVVTAAQGPLESVAALLMPDLLTLVRKPALIPVNADNVHAQAMMPIFLAIERETQIHAQGQMAAGMSLLTALCVQIARLSDAQRQAIPKANTRKVAQIEKFRALVEQNFKKHLSVSAYAEMMGITAGQLTRLCREELGMSSMDVINARVVHEAQRDLVYTISSIKQLSFSLGFADETYFGRFFRKHTGRSPREFRAQALDAMLSLQSL
ncbi:helix-turn-helix domain-containing protein [Rhodoferax sp. GW822-FHT02A01]|uniref:helix-turn-helix domain-containing protein n=1 Tax=Rhodoferax sp. GW822-FHT02A01 TaxID=3141537 RepID=UPI00315D7422